ncbi:MAG: hypothetical protein GX410_01970 [Elusimicrobia bacterium]|nr:hypothetical protein [Elusimicrobiota bacterium]
MKALSNNSGKSSLAVVAVLAIIVGAISWQFIIKPARLGAMAKETRTSLEVMRNALGKYFAQKGNYPETLDAMIPAYISKIPNSNPPPTPPSARVQYVSSASELDFGGGWAFDNNSESPTYGCLFVNAKGNDSKDQPWTSY